jgi:type II restriction enzyme
MSKKDELRNQREGTIINHISKRQEKILDKSVRRVSQKLLSDFEGINLKLDPSLFLKNVVSKLSRSFPDVDFQYYFDTSSMRPDGGVLSLISKKNTEHIILIAEKKNQGTNDLRSLEGKPKQAKGNAIERLGKNVIGLRTALIDESIFPFICFGDGCDFDHDSSILDRVVTIAMFGHLNKVYLHNQSDKFNRGSFFFRVEEWIEDEMFELCYQIAKQSVYYYFSKHGEDYFV